MGHRRVFPVQYVGDLCPVADSQATRLARINFLDRDLNPGSFFRRAEDGPDVSFRNRDPGLALDVQHFDHFISRALLGIGKRRFYITDDAPTSYGPANERAQKIGSVRKGPASAGP